jgi:hypothetical protein
VQIDKTHFNRLAATLNTGGRTSRPTKDRLQAEKFLTSRQLVEDLELLDSRTLGDPRTGDIFEQGALAIFQTLLGQEMITSIKEWFFVDNEHVTLVKIGGSHSSGDSFGYGESFTLTGTGSDAADTAAAVAAAINDSDVTANATVVGANDDVVRIVSEAVADENEQEWIGNDMGFSAGALNATIQKKGFDRYDLLWAFPSPEFIGEIVRVNGKGVKTEMWRDQAEDIVNRYSKEYFGLGVGNSNGAALLRSQRARLLP